MARGKMSPSRQTLALSGSGPCPGAGENLPLCKISARSGTGPRPARSGSGHRPGGKIDRISRRELPGCVKNPDALHPNGTRRGEGQRFLRWKELDCRSALCYDESRETAGFFAVKDLLIKVK